MSIRATLKRVRYWLGTRLVYGRSPHDRPRKVRRNSSYPAPTPLHDLYQPGQWHRWYKANKKWQASLRDLKRAGIKIKPNATSIPRWSVK